MSTVTCGTLTTSAVGLGCWTFGRQLDYAESRAIVHAALDAGIRFFDTADRYGAGTSEGYRPGLNHSWGKGKSEEFLGAALGSRRHSVIVSTKFGAGRGSGHRQLNGERENTGGGRSDYVVRCLEGSLTRLGTDYIDLFQMHEPDLVTPIDETLAALDRLVRDGKVREIGCSNFDSTRLRAADQAARAHGFARFVTVQNHYNVLHRQPEPELIAACEELEMKLLPYFPLASGVLTGKFSIDGPVEADTRIGRLIVDGREEKARRFWNAESARAVDRLRDFARERGRSLLELAISWLACQPVVGPILPGVSRPEQVVANAAAADWELSPAELDEIDSIVAAADLPFGKPGALRRARGTPV